MKNHLQITSGDFLHDLTPFLHENVYHEHKISENHHSTNMFGIMLKKKKEKIQKKLSKHTSNRFRPEFVMFLVAISLKLITLVCPRFLPRFFAPLSVTVSATFFPLSLVCLYPFFSVSFVFVKKNVFFLFVGQSLNRLISTLVMRPLSKQLVRGCVYSKIC